MTTLLTTLGTGSLHVALVITYISTVVCSFSIFYSFEADVKY